MENKPQSHAELKPLLPCPFCGGKAEGLCNFNNKDYVVCTECGVTQSLCDNAILATEQWNTRHVETHTAPVVAAKDAAYAERNKLVRLLASVYPSGIKQTAIEGWDEAWHWCVYIDLPNGQASWHFHIDDLPMFSSLPAYKGEWDGHTTEAKYDRILELAQATHTAPVSRTAEEVADIVQPTGFSLEQAIQVARDMSSIWTHRTPGYPIDLTEHGSAILTLARHVRTETFSRWEIVSEKHKSGDFYFLHMDATEHESSWQTQGFWDAARKAWRGMDSVGLRFVNPSKICALPRPPLEQEGV